MEQIRHLWNKRPYLLRLIFCYDCTMVDSLSVVIPAYNEAANLPACLQKVHSVLKTLKIDWEIIVVNDGSKDKTGEVAAAWAPKIPHLKIVTNNPNRGYGGSLKAGFYAATKEYITISHADNQLDFSEVNKLIRLQQETNADIVSGVREQGSDPLHRQLFRWGWNTLIRALFGYLASDIDSGFKLFRRSILDRVKLPSDGAMLDTQLLAGARARNMKVVELPVKHLPRTAGKSTGGNPKVIIKAFRELVVFWWQLKNEILVERGLAVFKWELLLLILLLLLGAFSRLYRINDYMTFLGDEGRDAIVMKGIVTGTHFPLIGPGTSIGNMYLGPLYYYLAAPSLAVFNLSPLGPAVFVSAIGLLTIGLLWWIGRQWFGRWPALAVSALYALSPTVIIYSRSSWNPNIMPFFALLTMYGVWKVWRFGYWRWLVISAVAFAFVLNSHYLGLLLVPTIILFWLLSPKTLNARRYTLVSILLLFLLLLPLLFFDMRHGWQNFGAMKTFFAARQTTVNLKAYKALPNLWPIWVDINSSLLTAKNNTIALLLSILIPVTVTLPLTKSKSKKDLVFILAWIGFGLIGLGLYKQHIYDHYYGFMFPAIFLLLGFVALTLRLWSIPIFLLLFTVTVTNSPLRTGPNYQLSRTKEISEFIKTQSGGQPIKLALLAKNNYDASYRYFLQLNNAPFYTIHDKLADQLFVICEMSECNPINNPLWEIAAFGWSKIDTTWEFPWGFKVLRLIHNILLQK